jgi:hypothetical protein
VFSEAMAPGRGYDRATQSIDGTFSDLVCRDSAEALSCQLLRGIIHLDLARERRWATGMIHYTTAWPGRGQFPAK